MGNRVEGEINKGPGYFLSTWPNLDVFEKRNLNWENSRIYCL